MTDIPTRTAYIDIESGGLRPLDRAWEIAVVVDNGPGTPEGLGQSHERHLFHVIDFAPAKADPKALEMNGYYDRHPAASFDEITRSCLHTCFPAHGLIFGESVGGCVNTHGAAGADLDHAVKHIVDHESCIAPRIEKLVRGAHVIINNPVYDVPRLVAMLGRAGIAWTGHYKPVCPVAYGAGVAGLAPTAPTSEVAAALGVDREGHGAAHGALPDALFNRDLMVAARAAIAARTSGT